MAGLVTGSSCSGVAEFAYDALGRRIKRFTKHDSQTTYYYHNSNWQVLTETDADGTTQRWFIYGNYIDEVLLIKADSNDYYYAQDHLYSPAALINASGSVVERYEYDAYGDCNIMDASYNPRSSSNYGNPYYFQGKRLDLLDNGGLELMTWPHRNYSTYLGRWLVLAVARPSVRPQNRCDSVGRRTGNKALARDSRKMRRNIFVIMTVVAWSCLLHGCDSYQGKQEDWHCKVDRGFTTVVDASRPGVSLVFAKKTIARTRVRKK